MLRHYNIKNAPHSQCRIQMKVFVCEDSCEDGCEAHRPTIVPIANIALLNYELLNTELRTAERLNAELSTAKQRLINAEQWVSIHEQ